MGGVQLSRALCGGTLLSRPGLNTRELKRASSASTKYQRPVIADVIAIYIGYACLQPPLRAPMAAGNTEAPDTVADPAVHSAFAQMSHEYVPPEAVGYQPLLEPLLPDLGMQPASSTPAEDYATNLRVTATNIGSSRFRRTVSVNQLEAAPSCITADHPSVFLGAGGPSLLPGTAQLALNVWLDARASNMIAHRGRLLMAGSTAASMPQACEAAASRLDVQ